MAGPLDPVGWEVYGSQQKREKKHREHIWKNAWLKIIRLVKKTSGFIGELENLRFNLKVKLQKAPPCRFGIDDLLGRPNNLPPPPPTLYEWMYPYSYSLVQQVLPRVYWGYTTFTTKGAGPLTVDGAIQPSQVFAPPEDLWEFA